MVSIVVHFGEPETVGAFSLDGKIVGFPFAVIEAQYMGTPRQTSQTTQGRITVQASGTLLAIWGVSETSMVKVLYQVAKEHIVTLLEKSGRAAGDIPLEVGTNTHPGPCPFDIDLIEEPHGAVVQLEVSRSIGFL